MTSGPNLRINQLRGAAVRGKNFTAALLSEIKAGDPIGSFLPVIRQAQLIRPAHHNSYLVEPNRVPARFFKTAPFPEVSLIREIAWAVAQLAPYKKQLIQFNSLRQRLTINMSSASTSYVSSIKLIDEIDRICGPSYWGMEAKISITQHHEGLERQKQLTKQLLSPIGNTVGAWMLHSCSTRNEDAVSAGTYSDRLRASLHEQIRHSDWSAFLEYRLAGSPLTSAHQFRSVLRVGALASIVDLFECLVDCAGLLLQNLSDDEEIREAKQAVRGLISSLNFTEDPRVLNIQYVEELFSLIPSRRMPYTYQRGPHVLQSVSSLIRSSREGDNSRKDYSALGVTFVAAIKSALYREDNNKEALSNIRKLSLNFRWVPAIAGLHRFMNLTCTSLPGEFNQLCASAALSDPLLQSDGETAPPLETKQASRWPFDISEKTATSIASPLSELDIYRTADNVNALDELVSEIVREGDGYDIIECLKRQFNMRLSHGKHWEALIAASRAICAYPGSESEFDLAPFFAGKKWKDIKQHAGSYELAVGLQIFCASPICPDKEQQKNLQFAAKALLSSRNLTHFHELCSYSSDLEKMYLVFFLRWGCTQQVMEINSALKSSRALDEERMKVCQTLVELDAPNSAIYLEEFREISYRLELREGVSTFDRSRMFIDLDGLRRVASVDLSEDFRRYQALAGIGKSDIGILRDAIQSIQGLENTIQNPRDVPKALWEEPKTESDKVLQDLILWLRDYYLLNQPYGLNTYLSLRIRHGSLSGHLRRPLEDYKLATHFDSSTQQYISNDEILDQMTFDSDAKRQVADIALKTFSKSFDELIEVLVKEDIQVRSAAKKKGLFDLPISTLQFNLIKANVSENSSVDHFISMCFSHFAIIAEANASKVRSYIQNEFKNRVGSLLEALRNSLTHADAEGVASSVVQLVTRAGTSLANEIDKVSDWFRIHAISDENKDYTFEQLIDIGIAVTKNARSGFFPVVTKNIQPELPGMSPSTGAFRFADAIFIALDNVYKHSGMGHYPSVQIDVRILSADRDSEIELSVTNEVAPGVETTSFQEKLAALRLLMDSDAYKIQLSGEGGTGFMKLCSLRGTAKQFRDKSNIRFRLEENKFSLVVLVPVYSIRSEAEAYENTSS